MQFIQLTILHKIFIPIDRQFIRFKAGMKVKETRTQQETKLLQMDPLKKALSQFQKPRDSWKKTLLPKVLYPKAKLSPQKESHKIFPTLKINLNLQMLNTLEINWKLSHQAEHHQEVFHQEVKAKRNPIFWDLANPSKTLLFSLKSNFNRPKIPIR